MNDPHTIAVLVLTIFALFLFTREKIPLETSAFVVLCLLALGFSVFDYEYKGEQVNPVDFFHGFGHEALIAVCALMVVGTGLVKTGALEPVGNMLSRMWKISPSLSLLTTLLIAAALSAFINNTPIVVLLIPILVSVALRTGGNPSSVLMPMGFATLLGGMGTTIGTSTNLLVVSVAVDLGLDSFNLFDFLLPASVAGIVGILYLWLIVPLFMPDRKPALSDTSPRIFDAFLLLPDNKDRPTLTLSELREQAPGMVVRQILRSNYSYIKPLPDALVNAGDRLAISDTPEHLKEYERALGGTLYTRDVKVSEEHPLSNDDQQLAEIVVTDGSVLANRTLRQSRIKDHHQLAVLALHREGRAMSSLPKGMLDTKLYSGDVILVQTSRDNLSTIRREGTFLILDATSDVPFTNRAPLAIGIMAAVVCVAALGILPIAASALTGVALLLLLRCLHWIDVGRALSTPVILVIVASLALALAAQQTGGAHYLAQLFLHFTEGFPPAMVLSALMLLMAVLTNIVSNNAAAVIGTPIAVSMANELGQPVEAFVLAVMFGANLSFATPMAYQTNLLVMNTGGYTFMDFVKVGLPLILLVWLTLSWLLPVLYGI